jgi:hypothetical protein
MAPNKNPKPSAPSQSPPRAESNSTDGQTGSGTQVDPAATEASLARSRAALGIGVIGNIPEGIEEIGDFSDDADTKTPAAVASSQKPKAKSTAPAKAKSAAKANSGTEEEGSDGSYRSTRGNKNRTEDKDMRDALEASRVMALGQAPVGTRHSERSTAGQISFLKTADGIGGTFHGNYASKKRKEVAAVVNAFRKGASLPHAPKAKPDWDDSYTRGRALSQLHPHHVFTKSDASGTQHVYQLSADTNTTDGKFIMLCYASALTNAKLPANTPIGELTRLMLESWEKIRELRQLSEVPSSERRSPLRAEGDGHQFVDEFAISQLTLELIASLDARELVEYCLRRGIPVEYLDFSNLPEDVLTSPKAIPDANTTWFTTALKVHRFFSKVFTKGITPEAIRIILRAYQTISKEGLHPADAWQFLESVFPGRFRTEGEAIVFIRGMIHFAHKCSYTCPDFIYKFFPGPLLGVFEFIMAENFAEEYDETRSITLTEHDTVQYVEQLARVVEKARAEGVGYMPLLRELFDRDNKHALLHLAGVHTGLLDMFPLYLEQTRMTKVQMYLAFHYHTTEEVSREFFVILMTVGGLAPGGYRMGHLEDERCSFSPLYNLAIAMYKCSDMLPPPSALGVFPPADCSEQGYEAWKMSLPTLTQEDRRIQYQNMEYRHSLSLTNSSGTEYPMRGTNPDVVVHSDSVEVSIAAHTHPVFADILSFQDWMFHEVVGPFLAAQSASLHTKYMDSLSLYRIVYRLPDTPATNNHFNALVDRAAGWVREQGALATAQRVQDAGYTQEYGKAVTAELHQAQQQDFSPGPSLRLEAQARADDSSAAPWTLDHNPTQGPDQRGTANPKTGIALDPAPRSSIAPTHRHPANSAIQSHTHPHQPFDADDEVEMMMVNTNERATQGQAVSDRIMREEEQRLHLLSVQRAADRERVNTQGQEGWTQGSEPQLQLPVSAPSSPMQAVSVGSDDSDYQGAQGDNRHSATQSPSNL